MSKPVTAVLYAPGTNCHEETIAAIEIAGGSAKLVLLRDLMDGRERLDDYQAAVVPGGFSYGDHLGAGRIFGTAIVARLRDQLKAFLDAGKPMLGVCNGFQVLTEAGILPARTPGKREWRSLKISPRGLKTARSGSRSQVRNASGPKGWRGRLLECLPPMARAVRFFVKRKRPIPAWYSASRFEGFTHGAISRKPERGSARSRRNLRRDRTCPGPDASPRTRFIPRPILTRRPQDISTPGCLAQEITAPSNSR